MSILKNGQILEIRPLTAEDAPAMVKYMAQVSGESDNLTYGPGDFTLTEEEEAALIKERNSKERGCMLGGFIEGALVSASNLSCEERPRIAHNAGIGLSVLQAHWDKGVASAMMTALIRAAQKAGVKALHLEVNCENSTAIHLYEKYGFEKVGVHKNFFNVAGRYIDILLMDLSL